MPPIYVKGGIWTNVEDEILKASISKYGLNQWSRVSSLLPNKTAKQCKQRWQEWLDPRIRKSEWTKEEDEKLLSLIKLRPNQWNSIGIMMNRTVNQCIERYQQLLSDSSARDDELSMVGNFVNKNDINMDAESKPARPDLEEMDEDEQEMLSEARARLANTQGKKAKRKAREKLLEENRRIAKVQRRRDLKAAGVDTKIRTKKNYATEMDYNADIAFERTPATGRFDTTKEDETSLLDRHKFDKVTDQSGTFNEEGRKQQKKERRDKTEQKLISAPEKLYAAKREKLVLSAPTDEAVLDDEDIDASLARQAQEIHEKSQMRSVLFAKREREDDRTATSRKRGRSEKSERKLLVKLLQGLPTPLNDYELVEDPTPKIGPSITVEGKIRMETGDSQIRLEELRHEYSTSQAAKLGLPVPKVKYELTGDEIDDEMMELIHRDYQANVLGHPVEPEQIDVYEEQRLRAEVETRIAAAMEKKQPPPQIDSQAGAEISAKRLMDLIKLESRSSAVMEKLFKDNVGGYEAAADQLQADIASKLVRLNELESDLTVQTELSQDESRAIALRSTHLQRGIDEMNVAVTVARTRLSDI